MSTPFSLPSRPEPPKKTESLDDLDFSGFNPKPKASGPSLPFGDTPAQPTPVSSWEIEFKENESESLEDITFDEDTSIMSPIVEDQLVADITVVSDDEAEISIDDLLEKLLELGASDLHLTAYSQPAVRINGEITRLEDYPRLSGVQIKDAIYSIMNTPQRNKFEDNLEIDFSYSLPGRSRFRVNVFWQQENVGVVMRTIPWEIKTFEDLDISPVLNEFVNKPRGLVLVTGPTGSGKSTTLAAIIDKINRTRPDHILTIEDPIEFVHEHRMGIVNQREVGRDTKSFGNALRAALREDPDVILVGEMRDLETIQIALQAAETGHLVFGTLHTQSAAETVTRIIDVFPDATKDQVRTQLAASIQGIVCQTLLKRVDKPGRIAALEILMATPNIRALIRDNKLQQIQSALITGGEEGMQTLDMHLERLVREGTIDPHVAANKSTNRKWFMEKLGGEQGIKDIERRNRAQRNTGFII